MKWMMMIAALLAIPITAQDVEFAPQMIVEDGAVDAGARVDILHETFPLIHPLASAQYEFGPDDLIVGAGARVALPGPVAARWIVARRFAGGDGGDVWIGVLSGELALTGSVGAFGSWYYTFRDSDAPDLPERFAAGILIR